MWIESSITIISILIFLFATVLTAVVINKGIYDPAALFSQASIDIQEGNFDAQMLDDLVRRPDENGRLAQAFIHMAEEIEVQETSSKAQIQATRTQMD